MSIFGFALPRWKSTNGSLVPVKKITKTYSMGGCAFNPRNRDTDQVHGIVHLEADADDIEFMCMLDLPDDAVIKTVIVYGNSSASAETWQLLRITTDGSTISAVANNNINSMDSSIIGATINNSNYYYYFRTSTLDTGDEIEGFKITYEIGG